METYRPPKIELYKIREFGEKLSVTIAFLRQNAGALLKSQLFISGPIAILASIGTGLFFSSMFGQIGANSDPQGFANSGAFVLKTALMYISFILLGISVAMVTYSYFLAYRESEDGKVSPSEVWQIMIRRIGTIIAAVFLLIVAFGLLGAIFFIMTDLLGAGMAFLIFLLVFPMFYFVVVMLLYFPVVIIEGANVFTAFRRAFQLIKGKWWSTFGLYFVTAFVGQMVAAVFIIPIYIGMGVSTFLTVRDGTENLVENNPFGLYGALLAVAIILGGILSQTIVQTAISFQYFNLVERSEGKGLLGKIENMDSEKTEDEGTY